MVQDSTKLRQKDSKMTLKSPKLSTITCLNATKGSTATALRLLSNRAEARSYISTDTDISLKAELNKRLVAAGAAPATSRRGRTLEGQGLEGLLAD